MYDDDHTGTKPAPAVSQDGLDSAERMRLMDRPIGTVERLLQIFATNPDHPNVIELRAEVEYVARAWGITPPC